MLLRFLVRCLVSDEADNPAVGSLGQQPEHGFGAAMVLVQPWFWCRHGFGAAMHVTATLCTALMWWFSEFASAGSHRTQVYRNADREPADQYASFGTKRKHGRALNHVRCGICTSGVCLHG